MKNINKIAFIGGLVFAIFDAICVFLVAFALKPFLGFWEYIFHIRAVGIEYESNITLGNVLGGIVGTFAIGFVLTWIFVRLHQKFCCKE